MTSRLPDPFAGTPVVAQGWPAAAVAGRLLELLGARVSTAEERGPALVCGALEVDSEPCDTATDWRRSGLAEITGRDRPLTPAGAPATVARGAGLALELLTAAAGSRVRVDSAALLSQRLPFLAGRRSGTTSFGGATRLLKAADGWWALSLPRRDDVELAPALIGAAVPDDPWQAVQRWCADIAVRDVVARAALLGLAAAAEGETPTPDAPWEITLREAEPREAQRPHRVVNLGALWAAPLTAHLLSRAGAQVIDVEDVRRPDGARSGTPAFYAALHAGAELRRLELRSADGIEQLRELITSADVVVEASRPRALEQLGVPAEAFRDDRPRVWLRITGHGRAEPHRVAFGDDAAVAGGLVARDRAGPVFAGDAIADPLTGLLAGTAAAALLAQRVSAVVDLSLSRCAAWARAAENWINQV